MEELEKVRKTLDKELLALYIQKSELNFFSWRMKWLINGRIDGIRTAISIIRKQKFNLDFKDII